MSDLSGLNPTPHAIAVYASRPLSPEVTQRSLPSGRCPLLGPVFHRLDRTSLPGALIQSSRRLSSTRNFAERDLWNASRGSLHLDVGGPDHLAPFLGFLGDELAEVGRRADKRCASEVSEPRLDFGIGEGRVDLLVELVDDLSWRGLG